MESVPLRVPPVAGVIGVWEHLSSSLDCPGGTLGAPFPFVRKVDAVRTVATSAHTNFFAFDLFAIHLPYRTDNRCYYSLYTECLFMQMAVCSLQLMRGNRDYKT